MMAVPTFKYWCKRAFLVAGAVVLIGLVVGGFFYLRCTAVIPPNESRVQMQSTVHEATHKLSLFRSSQRKGYVRLTEAELNGYLDELVAETITPTLASNANSSISLTRSRVQFIADGFVWNCWLKKTIGPVTREIAWQRLFELVRDQEQWQLRLSAMKLGRQTVPPRCWDWVNLSFGELDKPFTEKFRWLCQVPAMELKTNELSLRLELKLYNYPASNVLIEARK
jgi:hypothetical protein